MNDLLETKLDTVIVEDHPDCLIQLKALLPGFPGICLIGEAGDGKSAIELIQRSKPHLVFLDIHLPDMDGFQVLKHISHEPAVIFITAYHQYAVQAFEVNGVDYLLKPVSKERLERAINKVLQRSAAPYDAVLKTVQTLLSQKTKKIRFSIKRGDQLLVILQDQVFYFKVEDRYLYLCTYDKAFIYNSTLRQLEQSLDPELFLRINKSQIASLDKIRCLKRDYMNRYRVILQDKNNTALKISRKYLQQLKEKLDNLV